MSEKIKFFNQTPVAFAWQLSDFQFIIYCSFTTVFKKFEIICCYILENPLFFIDITSQIIFTDDKKTSAKLFNVIG